MRVILRDNIENLGKKGDIVNVAPGYGRNYLIPKKMAIEVTSRNSKMIAIEQKALQKGFEKEKASYQELIDRLNAVTLSFVRKTSEKDVIFGSVSSTDIRDALIAQGLEVEKRKIILDEPIKRLGNYTVPIKIFHEERAEVKIEVVKEGEPSTKEEAEPGLVEEGAAVSTTGEEETKIPVEEEKKEDIQESLQETGAPPESEPVVEEDIAEEQKQAPQETETQESTGQAEAAGEKETDEEASIKETKIASSDTPSEPQDVPMTETEEKPKETGSIPEEEGATPGEPGGGLEDTPGLSEKTHEGPEKTERVANETERPEEDNDKDAANKENT